VPSPLPPPQCRPGIIAPMRIHSFPSLNQPGPGSPVGSTGATLGLGFGAGTDKARRSAAAAALAARSAAFASAFAASRAALASAFSRSDFQGRTISYFPIRVVYHDRQSGAAHAPSLLRQRGQRLPTGDGPGARPRLYVVGDAREQPAQLDGGR
jgi:hypothetical protein